MQPVKGKLVRNGEVVVDDVDVFYERTWDASKPHGMPDCDGSFELPPSAPVEKGDKFLLQLANGDEMWIRIMSDFPRFGFTATKPEK